MNPQKQSINVSAVTQIPQTSPFLGYSYATNMRSIVLIGAGYVAAGLTTWPRVCQSEPPLGLTAGHLVSAQ